MGPLRAGSVRKSKKQRVVTESQRRWMGLGKVMEEAALKEPHKVPGLKRLENAAMKSSSTKGRWKMERIECQGKHKPSGGCYACGGYGYLVEKTPVCRDCSAEAWVRPGNYTMNDGKQFTSFDGLVLTYHFADGESFALCPDCERKFSEKQKRNASVGDSKPVRVDSRN